jgi:hypothetical protein
VTIRVDDNAFAFFCQNAIFCSKAPNLREYSAWLQLTQGTPLSVRLAREKLTAGVIGDGERKNNIGYPPS